MNSTSKILHKIAKESNGEMRIVKVPKERRPTAELLAHLDREIKAQIDANDAMRYRSYINASKKV